MRCRKGVAAIEFAFVAPILALVLMGVMDLGSALQQKQRLTAAAQAGAAYALTHPADSTGIQAAVNRLLGGWSGVTVTVPAPVCECPGVVGPVNCDTVCLTGRQTYVSITLTRSFTPLLLRNLSEVSANVVLRLQ
ncbi:TadE/TadG family type IV pilus assembly protein [Sabulicella rubraurantiaca]|uniref:TadE/TadG family type IV pilus assembly protein n=1 Tax=Sabulicella rubraurantiaca TaxID=2811429 RepID=UPI001A974B05|nr:TadE/TadG family type IV pilus assembly protein [Sabulicella rubraurantiaca]